MIEPRKTVKEMEAYAPPLEGRRAFVRLDFNENTAGFPAALDGLPPAAVAVYPEYEQFQRRLAAFYRAEEGSLLLTNGSGEALFTAAFTFAEPGQDRAVTSKPTFALIPHCLHLVGARLIEVQATSSLDFDLEGIEKALLDGVKLAVFASPDNPTGAVLSPEKIRTWCTGYPGTLFVIDEAYAEYGGDTVLPLAGEFENLLVSRTFSKAWGMAGLRLGALIGHESLIREMRKVRSPYSVNTAALHAAGKLLERSEEVVREAGRAMERKKRLLEEVASRGYRIRAGAANFFLLKTGIDAEDLCQFCREQGLLLRNRSHMPGLGGVVRVTVGTEAENRIFLRCLDGFRNARALIFDLDDTLVDTSQSYDAVVAALVERHSGSPLHFEELERLRAGGGFNDDWDATWKILQQRGVEISRKRIEEEGRELYLAMAPAKERMLVPAETLRGLAKRFRLFLHTGRPRGEYEPVWGERLDPLFERIVCKDDLPGARSKPAPDQLDALLQEQGVSEGYYIGNSVDDMRAAAAAGLGRIGVTTTLDARALQTAGAERVIPSTDSIGEEFMI